MAAGTQADPQQAFEDARIRGKYWQIIIDGTQLYRSREDLGEHSLFCRKRRGQRKNIQNTIITC